MITQENIPYTTDEVKAMVKTIEELRKKYDGALERARKIHHETEFDYEKGMMEEIFPELKESEDERIRKALIEYFEEQCDMSDWNGVYGYQVLAWLEKQDGQKQTWEPSAAQLIVIEDLIKDESTSKVNKVILRGMLDEFKQFTNTHKQEIEP